MIEHRWMIVLVLILSSQAQAAKVLHGSCIALFQRQEIIDYGRKLYRLTEEGYDRNKFEPNTEEFIRSVRIPELKKNAKQNGDSTDAFYEAFGGKDKFLHLGVNRELTHGKRIREDSEAVFVFMPGQGGENSNVNSVLRIVSAINSRKVNYKRSVHGKIRERINKNGERIPLRYEKDPNDPSKKISIYSEPLFKDENGKDVYAVDPKNGEPLIYFNATAEAIEMPGRAGAKSTWELETFEQTLEYYASYFKALKEDAGDLPIFLVGRSSSAMMAAVFQMEINRMLGYEVISASASISPMYPSKETLPHNKYSTSVYDKKLYEEFGPNVINEEIYKWAFKSHEEIDQMGITSSMSDPKEPSKMLFMSATRDPEVTDIDRVYLNDVANSSPLKKHVAFKDKEDHDILQTEDTQLRAQAYYALYSYLRQFIKSGED
tara:strand:+ start:52878 stop:54176 length:1299 start_codon:yes stop_codon:yes gene_type:complete